MVRKLFGAIFGVASAGSAVLEIIKTSLEVFKLALIVYLIVQVKIAVSHFDDVKQDVTALKTTVTNFTIGTTGALSETVDEKKEALARTAEGVSDTVTETKTRFFNWKDNRNNE